MQVKDFGVTDIGINEQRDFTNPHVRFIRKNGRIIPIVNKKRVGQDVTVMGEAAMKTGAVISAASIFKNKIAKSNPIKRFGELFKNAGANIKSKPIAPTSISGKLIKHTSFGVLKSAKHVFKHSGKYGLGLLGLGLTGIISGADIQMRSGLGKDLFFIKDQNNLGS